MSDKTEHILFITLSCVGDAVMSTPVLQALHQAFPEATIDIVADKRSAGIFLHCPYLGRIYYKHKEGFLRGAPALVRQLRARRYDIIVDIRTDGLAYLIRGKKRYTKRQGESYGKHAIESLMGIIRPIHGDRPLPGTHIWMAEEDSVFAREVTAQFENRILLAIGPGCSGKRRQKFWPVSRYTKLANSVSDIFDGVILTGGPGDELLAREISKNLQLPYVDMCNKTSLLQAAALLHQAKMFIGSDSGLGHVAAAVGTATLSLFSVDDPARCLPWGPSADWIMGDNRDAGNISVAAVEAKVRAAMSCRERSG